MLPKGSCEGLMQVGDGSQRIGAGLCRGSKRYQSVKLKRYEGYLGGSAVVSSLGLVPKFCRFSQWRASLLVKWRLAAPIKEGRGGDGAQGVG